MLFSTGERISQKLSEYLLDYTTVDDRAAVMGEFSEAYIWAIATRRRKITENVIPHITELFKIAIRKRSEKEKWMRPVHNVLIKELG